MHQLIIRIPLVFCAILMIVVAATQPNIVVAFFGLAAVLVAFWIVWRFPVIAVIGLFVTGAIPNILVFTPTMVEAGNTIAIGGGLNAVDIVFMLMLGAVIVRIAQESGGGITMLPRILYWPIVLLGFWFVVSMLRNWDAYGIATLGEVRYRFFSLIIPIYLGYFFRTVLLRLQLFKVIILGTVFLPLALIPIVGQELHWAFGSVYRFFPPEVSLGIVFGVIGLFLARRYNYINIWTWLMWVLVIITGFLIIADSPRSTWLAMLVAFIVLIAIGELNFSNSTRLVAVVIAVALIVIVVVFAFGTGPLEIILERGKALYAPQVDDSSTWRMVVWRTYIQYTIESSKVVMGDGFGQHWDFDVGGGRVLGVFPHNVFIMFFVKMGLVGLSLYLYFIIAIGVCLWRFLMQPDARQDPEFPLVLMAITALTASQAYYIAFGLDYYAWLFVGLGIAVISKQHSYETAPLIYCDPSPQPNTFHT